MNDADLFAQLMGQVEPLNKGKTRVLTQKTKTKHEILRNLEQQETTQRQVAKNESLSVQRTEPWLLRADGVASKDIKKLAQNKLKHELDLHGLNQKESVAALTNFFHHALVENIRQISVVHGKGNHSQGKSVLKDTTYHWLEFGEYASHILAAIPASQSKGGACNILLRKNNP